MPRAGRGCAAAARPHLRRAGGRPPLRARTCALPAAALRRGASRFPSSFLPPRLKHVVAVRALCEFTAKAGDLDLRFTPAPTAQEGVAGHALVAARRRAEAGYRSELALSGEHRGLVVRGRADGWDAARGRLEEVKTHRGDLARQPANHRRLHWAQAQVYGALLCRQLGLAEVEIALVYLDLSTQKETVFAERHDAAALQAFFEDCCGRYLHWAAQEAAHRAARDAALAALRFPHGGFRTGQRPLAQAVYNAARSGRCLLAQAPTGIGKTVGTLFPLLKAFPGQAIDKLYFLTAKGSGRRLALEALGLLRGGEAAVAAASGAPAVRPRADADEDAACRPPASPAGSPPGEAASAAPTHDAPLALLPTADAPPPPAALPLRVVELVARDKACEHPDKACHGDDCPLARGFWDRLPAARAAALAPGTPLDREALREVALAHEVCPYYLGQEMVRWADAVVADYNHWYDASALLHALAASQGWRVAVLVDEAHNLIERARAMYSAGLDRARLGAVRRAAPPALKRPLDRLGRAWAGLVRGQQQAYRALDEVPARFAAVVQETAAAVAEHLEAAPAGIDSELLRWQFELLHFSRLVESFGAHSLFDIALAPAAQGAARPGGAAAVGSVLCVRNVVPAPFLAPRHAAARSTTLFSATLSPPDFHRRTLGLPEDTAWLDVESPFDAAQLAVRIAGHVSTRWRDRERSLAPIVELIARQYAERPGNYLAFFSSFDYLERVAVLFEARHPRLPAWRQSRGMDAAARDAFLARFEEGGRGVGFAVLGGTFGEGIDLPGSRLVGAFVATLGLPPVSEVNEQMRRRLDAAFGAGYDYAYLYPGLQKVVQAAGRVIRTPEDRGVVVLIDDRYARAEVRRLLPAWWELPARGGGGPAGAAGRR